MTEPPSRQRLFEAIAAAVRHSIQNGTYPVGEHLPSIQQLSELHGASHMTIKNALHLLQAEGILSIRAGVPAQVTAMPNTAKPVQAQLDELRSTVDRLAERLDLLESHGN
jgi:GntR family transcriptional repressor for pyruvate dehydrogenase complex